MSSGRRAPTGGDGSVAAGEAPPQAMSPRVRRMLPQGNAPFAGFRGRALAKEGNREIYIFYTSTRLIPLQAPFYIFYNFYTANLTKVKNENSMRKILSPHLPLLFLLPSVANNLYIFYTSTRLNI